MKTVTILMMFLFWMTSHVMAGVLLPEPSLDSLAVDELSLKASGVEVKDMPTVRPEVLSSEERQLLRYSVKVAKINTQWTPLYGTASKTRVISSAPFLKEIGKRNEQAISAISSQTVVYDLKQGEDKSELTLTLSFSKEGELKTEAFNVKEGKKSLFFSLKTPSTLKKTQYQSLIANKLLELLGKEEEKVSNWELISVRPFRYAQDKALFAFQLPKHKDLIFCFL
ncbi:MAG: hypothetical protein HYW85_06865 [Deltaproteobacteria bacterium]|nr:hypothetical protein [Deltaproteobacteria bacterium]